MSEKLKLILLTTPENLMSECNSLEALLAIGGIDYLHVRKDTQDSEYIKKIVNRIPKIFRPNLVLHGHQAIAEHYKIGAYHHKTHSDYSADIQTTFQTKAFHSIEEIKNCKHPYKYGFLSPVFDSITKKDYKSTFDFKELKQFLHSDQKPFPIFALGGIAPGNVKICKELGFDGVAVMGAIWEQMFLHKKIEVFEEIKAEL